MAVLVINDSLEGSANIRLSAALADWTDDSVPDHSEVNGMVMKSLRVIGLKAGDR